VCDLRHACGQGQDVAPAAHFLDDPSRAGKPDAVLVPLSSVLALPEVAAASPTVLVGDPDRTLIRWAHSSEVFEMGPLLSGGELLLTTGLGLRGVSAAAQGRYVEALADAGLAALALELGRTFSEMPDGLLRAAERRHLTLISLGEVVPFAVVVEAFHRLVMDGEIAGLRRGERIWRELTTGVLERGGLHALVRRIADLAGGVAFLVAGDGRVVAASHKEAVAPRATGDNSRPVEVGGASWGTLILDTRRGQLCSAVLDRAPSVVALELIRAGATPETRSLGSALLYDVVHDRLPSVEELRTRCEIAGFPAARGRPLVALSVVGDRRVPRALLGSSAQRACIEIFGACLVGEVDDEVLMVVRLPRGREAQLRQQLDQLSGMLSDAMERTTGHAIVAVTAGSPVDEIDQLARSIAQSREIAVIARRLGTRRGAMLARDLGIYRLLVQLQSGPELSVFLREQLGVLLDHDAAHGSELVRTLDAYFRHGLAKTETAAALGVRRQTLYNRLARIGELLGGDPLTDYERRTALSVALHAWQLRTGLDPGESLRAGTGS
jgi:purine catabolism regulator